MTTPKPKTPGANHQETAAYIEFPGSPYRLNPLYEPAGDQPVYGFRLVPGRLVQRVQPVGTAGKLEIGWSFALGAAGLGLGMTHFLD